MDWLFKISQIQINSPLKLIVLGLTLALFHDGLGVFETLFHLSLNLM